MKKQTESKKINELKAKLKQTDLKIQEYLSGWQRAKADYLNLEIQTEKQRSEWMKFANMETIKEIIQILESFEHSLIQAPKEIKSHQWTKGIEQIVQQINGFLKAQGVEKIKTVGEKFNPDYHEALYREKGSEDKEDIICKEIQAGYQMHGKVIKPAKVAIK